MWRSRRPEPRRAASVAAALALVAVAWAQPVSAKPRDWPREEALPHFPAPRHLDVADVSTLTGDEQLLFNTLEGLVNRPTPRIYLLWNADEGKRTWLNTLRRRLRIGVTDVTDAWRLLRTYRASVAGVIVYDPSVPDTINVATSLAAREHAVVAAPALVAKLAAPPYRLRVVDDLRGRFLDRLDAYQWAYDNLWTRGSVTHRMLIGLPPFASSSVHLADLGAANVPLEPLYDSGALPGVPFASLRDYAIAAGAMVVWLDNNEPAERMLLERILSEMPPDSPYLGTHAGDVAGEITIVALLSSHNVYELAADYFNNGSVFGGAVREPKRARPAPTLRLDRSKIYVTFTMSDGDNIQYDQRRLRKMWDDPARGSVPINWTISPLLLDAAPTIFDYYTRTASRNDLLMAGPSGAGYAYPASWPNATFRTFTRQTGAYMRRAGIDTVDILDAPNGVRMPLSAEQAADYVADVRPKGIMVNYNYFPECRTDNTFAGDTPITTGCMIASSSTAQGEAEFDIQQQTARCSVPCFISIEFTAWNVMPSDVRAVAKTLDSRHVVVRADQFFDLLRRSRRP